MTLSWSLHLRCPDCGAVVTWTDERPAWQRESRATLWFVPDVRHFLSCPACGSRIYRDDHAPEPSGEDAPAVESAGI